MKGRPSASSRDADGSTVDQENPLEIVNEVAAPDRPNSDPPLSPSSARSRRSTNITWKVNRDRNGTAEPNFVVAASKAVAAGQGIKTSALNPNPSTMKIRRGPWSITYLIFFTSIIGLSLLATILYSLVTQHLDPKGCRMSYMRPSYIKFSEFDTEHTRFASKYSLYLYREQTVNDDKVNGLPPSILLLPSLSLFRPATFQY